MILRGILGGVWWILKEESEFEIHWQKDNILPYGYNVTFCKKTIPQSLRASSLYTREPLFKSVSDTGDLLIIKFHSKKGISPSADGA